MTGANALSRTGQAGSAPERRRPIGVMIVDDSMVARAVLSRMIEADGGFEILAVAATAEDAIEALRQVQVDIILLDLEMPGLGGLKSIPDILKAANGARVMIVSSQAEEGAEETVAALALGAADTLPKPGTGRFKGRFSEVLVARLRALGHADPRQGMAPDRRAPAAPRAMPPLTDTPIKLLAIGSSTGGIHALGEFFAALPRRIGVPILVTQHLPAPFMDVFARQLGTAAGREAIVATDGLVLRPDRIVIAPEGTKQNPVPGGLAVTKDGKTNEANKTILLADDHPLVRDSLARVIAGARPPFPNVRVRDARLPRHFALRT